MMRTITLYGMPFALLALGGCAADGATLGGELGEHEAPVIYGADTRLDYFEASSRARSLSHSTALMVSRSGLRDPGGGTCTTADASCYLRVDNYLSVDGDGDNVADEDLCYDDRFYLQLQAIGGYCSAFLVGPKTIVTAGHCIATQTDCNNTSIVFGFAKTDASTATELFSRDDIYQCSRVLGSVQQGTEDWAVFELDRFVTGRPPLPVRHAGRIATFAPVTLIGHPAALTTKVDPEATSYDIEPSANWFEAGIDAIGGNSGSAVFNSAGVVEGILSSGNTDYVLDSSRGCYSENRCGDLGCDDLSWETVSRIAQAEHLIPLDPASLTVVVL